MITDRGNVPICEVSVGDKVLSYDEEKQTISLNRVSDVLEFTNTKPTIRVTLKNGQTITATEDHEFWHEGGWVSLRSLVSLWEQHNQKHKEINNGNLETNPKL